MTKENNMCSINVTQSIDADTKILMKQDQRGFVRIQHWWEVAWGEPMNGELTEEWAVPFHLYCANQRGVLVTWRGLNAARHVTFSYLSSCPSTSNLHEAYCCFTNSFPSWHINWRTAELLLLALMCSITQNISLFPQGKQIYTSNDQWIGFYMFVFLTWT